MDTCCPVLRVVTSTDVRVAGLSSLSSPRAWTSIARAISVKLSEVDMLLVLQARSNVSREGNLCI